MLGFLKREGERGNGDEVSLVRDESIFPKNEVEIVRGLLWQTFTLGWSLISQDQRTLVDYDTPTVQEFHFQSRGNALLIKMGIPLMNLLGMREYVSHIALVWTLTLK